MSNGNELRELERLLAKACVREDEVGVFARRLQPLVEAIRLSPALVRPSMRGGGELEYSVEGDVLTERRLKGNSKPFRCSKAIYDAVVAALLASDRPLHIEEVIAAVEVPLGTRPAEFQVRVPLRLWMHMDQPLLVRTRARYMPAEPEDFKRAAVATWLELSASK